jgi:hypothetical protein
MLLSWLKPKYPSPIRCFISPSPIPNSDLFEPPLQPLSDSISILHRRMPRTPPLSSQPIRNLIASPKIRNRQVRLRPARLDTSLIQLLKLFLAIPPTRDYGAWRVCEVVGGKLGVQRCMLQSISGDQDGDFAFGAGYVVAGIDYWSGY